MCLTPNRSLITNISLSTSALTSPISFAQFLYKTREEKGQNGEIWNIAAGRYDGYRLTTINNLAAYPSSLWISSI